MAQRWWDGIKSFFASAIKDVRSVTVGLGVTAAIPFIVGHLIGSINPSFYHAWRLTAPTVVQQPIGTAGFYWKLDQLVPFEVKKFRGMFPSAKADWVFLFQSRTSEKTYIAFTKGDIPVDLKDQPVKCLAYVEGHDVPCFSVKLFCESHGVLRVSFLNDDSIVVRDLHFRVDENGKRMDSAGLTVSQRFSNQYPSNTRSARP